MAPFGVVMVLLLAACSGFGVKQNGPPIDLLVANVTNTEHTVVLKIIGAERVWADRVYVTWEIDAEVIYSFKGRLQPGDSFRYNRTVEVGLWTPEIGSRHLASFEEKDDRLIIPDVAYHFSSTSSLERRLRRHLD